MAAAITDSNTAERVLFSMISFCFFLFPHKISAMDTSNVVQCRERNNEFHSRELQVCKSYIEEIRYVYTVECYLHRLGMNWWSP